MAHTTSGAVVSCTLCGRIIWDVIADLHGEAAHPDCVDEYCEWAAKMADEAVQREGDMV